MYDVVAYELSSQCRSVHCLYSCLKKRNHFNIDRVYCDLHDDFVVRKRVGDEFTYSFYQVKTKSKLNENWTVGEIFGLYVRANDQNKQTPEKIKDSFVGKLLLHTVLFGDACEKVVFQTNIHTDDDINDLHDDIVSNTFTNRFSIVLIKFFNSVYKDNIQEDLSEEEVKRLINKFNIETDVHYLKCGDHNFEPFAREQIYKYSEVDLGHEECK